MSAQNESEDQAGTQSLQIFRGGTVNGYSLRLKNTGTNKGNCNEDNSGLQYSTSIELNTAVPTSREIVTQ